MGFTSTTVICLSDVYVYSKIINMKTCFVCLIEKPLESFYRHPQMADGHLNKCIECARHDALNHRRDNLSRVRDYDRKRGDSPSRVAARKAYALTEAGKASLARGKKAWELRNKHKKSAVIALNNALRDKRIFKTEVCQKCGLSGRLEAHHPDYSKPLEVLWVHDPCHKQIHKEERAARRD